MHTQWNFLGATIASFGLLFGCTGELGFEAQPGQVAKNNAPNNVNNKTNNVDSNNTPQPGEVDPGRVTIHRLNRAEYNNTIRDLLQDNSRPADNFPEDDFGYGFNNIADVLSLSPIHIESYSLTAEQLIDKALDPGAEEALISRYEAENITQTVGSARNEYWNLYSTGEVTTVHQFPVTGQYKITVRAYQSSAGPDDAQMAININGTPAQIFDVPNTSSQPGVFEVTTEVQAGGQAVAVAFLNDFFDPNGGGDRNLYVDFFEIEGPLGVTSAPSPVRDEILTCDPGGVAANQDSCAKEIIQGFGRRAWRRPLTDVEITRLAEFVTLALDEGDDFETGIRLALRAILMSPHFIYRVEIDDDVDNATPHALTDHELASRLSYFLWSSMPDAELFRLADEGKLNDEAVLRAQVARMLDNPKSIALIDTMATQWLYIDAVLDSDPDYELFPEFDDELKLAMRGETRAFVSNLIGTNAPLSELLTADYTFLNSRLARHYGVQLRAASDTFEKYQWTDDVRRGIISHGGLLTATSHRTRTSPVERGAWVLSNILCSEPPAPPPGVEGLVTPEPGNTDGKTMRDRMAEHAANPTCAACHYLMDPIGLGMENFDATGAWRIMEGDLPIDPAGELPGDVVFSGPGELSQILGAHNRMPRCAIEKFATFALGRGMEPWDETFIENVVATTEPNGHRFRDIIETIVLSESFRMRRGGTLKGEESI